jgi:membrane protein involved in colicin uptake
MPKKLNESPIEYHDRLLSLDQDAVDDLSDEEAALHRKLRKQKKEAERKAEEERKAEGERQKAKAARKKKKAEAEEAKRKEEAANKRGRSVEDEEEKDDEDASRPLTKKAKSEFASKVCHSLGVWTELTIL